MKKEGDAARIDDRLSSQPGRKASSYPILSANISSSVSGTIALEP